MKLVTNVRALKEMIANIFHVEERHLILFRGCNIFTAITTMANVLFDSQHVYLKFRKRDYLL